MKTVLLAFILFYGSVLHATPWIAASYGFRFENDTDTGHLATRNPYGFLAGHRWSSSEVFADFTVFTMTTGNSTLSIKRTNQIGLAGYRYYPFELSKGFTWYPYLSLGFGGTREFVKTQFIGQTVESESKVSLVSAAGMGVWGLVVNHLRAGAEFRALGSQEFSPAIMMELSGRVGYEF